MNMQQERLQERLTTYSFLSYFLLTLPNEDYAMNVLKLRLDKAGKRGKQWAVELINAYIKSSRWKPLSFILQELSVDRTRLLGGLTEERPLPPYESSFVEMPQQEVIERLHHFYSKVDFDSSCVRPDQIGVELSFMKNLCQEELKAIMNGNFEKRDEMRLLQQRFFVQHLGIWVGLFTNNMEKFAETDFFRGLAKMLNEFMTEENENFRNTELLNAQLI